MADKRGYLKVLLTATLTTNLLAPVAGVNVFFRKVRVMNITAGALTVSLWKGATGTNTDANSWKYRATTVPANSAIEVFMPGELFTPSDFLVGGASSANGLVLEADYDSAVA